MNYIYTCKLMTLTLMNIRSDTSIKKKKNLRDLTTHIYRPHNLTTYLFVIVKTNVYIYVVDIYIYI